VFSCLRKCALLVPVAALLAASAGPAQTASPPGWRVYADVQADELTNVVADAPGDAWATGMQQNAPGSLTFQPLVVHWNGHTWRQVTLPSAVAKTFGSSTQNFPVGASSASDMWAFGQYGQWLHWNGHNWTAGTMAPPAPGGPEPDITATQVFSPSDVWAFGTFKTRTSQQASYVAHFDGHRWRLFSLPGAFGVTTASAVARDDIWIMRAAAGTSGPSAAVSRWNGRTWQNVPLPPALTKAYLLYGIVALSARDVWVGGEQNISPANVTPGVAAHWNGRTWKIDKFPPDPAYSGDALMDMVSDGHGGVWALGTTGPGEPDWVLWHYTGGKWSAIVPAISGAHQVVGQLAFVPHTTSVWAVGTREPINSSSGAGMILLNGNVP
jgi:hypothetical protein